MPKLNCLTCSLSVAAMLVGAPAIADITAAELWAEWQANGITIGQPVSAAAVETTPNGLVLRGYASTTNEGNAVTSGSLDEVRLIEMGDGTVSIELSDVYTLVATFPEDADAPNGNLITVELEVRYDGLDVRASGSVGALVYDYSADTITMTDGTIADTDGVEPDIAIAVVATGLSASYAQSGLGDAATFASSSNMNSLAIDINAAPPPEESPNGQFKFSMLMSDIASTGRGSFDGLSALAQISTAGLPDSFDLGGDTSYGELTYDLSFEDGSDAFRAAGGNAGGAMAFSISQDGVGYDLSANSPRVQVAGSDIPFPIDVSAESAGISFLIPLLAADTPSDMAIGIDYRNLTVNDAIWSMFDPGAIIPRDPATLVLNVTGTVQIFMDLIGLDPEELTGPPGELRSVNIEDAQLSVAGAALTADGDFTFTPNQVMPMPIGMLNLNLSGANALLDRLVQGGVLRPEQAAMARGMSGMFTRPGPSPDTLETTIDFLPGGGITANGIPLQ